MKNKNVIILIIIVIVLAVGVGVFAVLNAGDIKAKNASQENATVTVKYGEQEITFDLVYLMTLEKSEFTTTMDTSKSGPEDKSFAGVPLVTVLNDNGFGLEGAEQVTFSAVDGYTSVVTAEEAADSENVYLVYEMEGQPLGTKADGGKGPIMMVVRKDQFAQRWCKFLAEIEVQLPAPAETR